MFQQINKGIDLFFEELLYFSKNDSIFKGEFSFHIIYYQCLYSIPMQSYANRKKIKVAV